MNNRPACPTLRIALTHDRKTDSDFLLSFEEIRRIAKAAVACGVDSFELAGGEPLNRADIPVLVMMLSSLTILKDMTLTTDGILLPRWAKSLRGAGIRRVIVKLDTFNPVKYRQMTDGGDINAVLAGIRAAMEVGFPPATIEVRLIRGVNDDEIPSLVRLTRLTGASLRFMEMTEPEAAAFGPGAHMDCAEALRLAPELEADAENNCYRLPGAAGSVSFIPCSQRETGCIILSADGVLYAGEASCCTRGLDDASLTAAVARLLG